jgi:prepilin-type N-terminal cleavage/methylation domain-containing protein
MRNQKGFTMIELILYMGLFSILLLVLLQIFSSILSVHLESQATSSVDQEANFILSRLTYDVHRAKTIDTPSISTLHLTGTGMDETYAISGNSLQLTDVSGPEKLNSSDVTPSITYTILGDTGKQQSVQIKLTMTSNIKRTGGLIETQTYTTTVQTRP